MIYTVTFNPTLDYIVYMDSINLGMVNRSLREVILCGGKGINVSTVLHNLGISSICLGFLAGFVGKEIERQLQKSGCETDFIFLEEGCSRINIKLKAEVETEVNGRGPNIQEKQIQEFMLRLEKVEMGDYLVLAGNIPTSLPNDIYKTIINKMVPRGVKVVVDAEKKLLLNTLPFHPFLIKPNKYELGDCFGCEIKTKEDAAFYGKELQQMGAENVLVSMGAEGAILLDRNKNTHILKAPKGKLINSTGAGDSMVAGFLAGYMESADFYKAFRMGVAAGSASAFSELLATQSEVKELVKLMKD